MIKNDPMHTISYELHQYMPCNILFLLIWFTLILLFFSLSNRFSGFVIVIMRILINTCTFYDICTTWFFVYTESDAKCTLYFGLASECALYFHSDRILGVGIGILCVLFWVSSVYQTVLCMCCRLEINVQPHYGYWLILIVYDLFYASRPIQLV